MNACVFIVAPAGGPGSLLDTANALDLGAVLPFRGVAGAERQARRKPLVFFLFDAVADPRTHAPVATAIRASSSPAIRFAPLVCFTRDPSPEAIRACINMGFDDIVTLPVSRPQLRRRIDRQVDTRCVYYETQTYFGPDRRNRLHETSEHSGRGRGGQFRRFEILRSSRNGVRILSNEQQVVL